MNNSFNKKKVNESWFKLDPDFRPSPPKNGPYCCRCQKAIKGKSIRVAVNWETWAVREDINGQDLIGPDCWRIITEGKV